MPGEYTGPPIGHPNSCSGEQSREAVERTISQTQQGFSAFIAAANNSVSMMPHPTTYMSLKAISLTEQSVKAVFDHAKALLHANAMKLQDRIFEGTIRRRNRPAKRWAATFSVRVLIVPEKTSRSSKLIARSFAHSVVLRVTFALICREQGTKAPFAYLIEATGCS